VLACPRVRALGGIRHGAWLSGPLRYQPGRPARRRRRRDCRTTRTSARAVRHGDWSSISWRANVKPHPAQDTPSEPSRVRTFFTNRFKGTPSARQARPAWAEFRRGNASVSRDCVTRLEDQAEARRGCGQLADSGADGLPRPPGRKPSGRGAAARSAGPRPRAGSPRRNAPGYDHDRENRPGRPAHAEHADCRAKGHRDRAGSPRIFRSGPPASRAPQDPF
jgi:hypothetical protein